jgi:soluble lytic murein transglycosylase-like protein
VLGLRLSAASALSCVIAAMLLSQATAHASQAVQAPAVSDGIAASPSKPATPNSPSPTSLNSTSANSTAPKAAQQKAGAEGAIVFKAMVRALVERETSKTGLPADIADAVIRVESNYDPTVIGGVGEIGLMQIRPSTAAMLGFKGTPDDLAKPDINIHYGVAYLAKAWRLANGDLCRALMKYRAGHGEEIMTPRSVTYCSRARDHLAMLGSSAASAVVPTASVVAPAPSVSSAPKLAIVNPKSVYTQYRQGTPAASHAFWAAQEARVRAITSRLRSRQRFASR